MVIFDFAVFYILDAIHKHLERYKDDVVVLDKCWQLSIYLQISVLLQPRASLRGYGSIIWELAFYFLIELKKNI